MAWVAQLGCVQAKTAGKNQQITKPKVNSENLDAKTIYELKILINDIENKYEESNGILDDGEDKILQIQFLSFFFQKKFNVRFHTERPIQSEVINSQQQFQATEEGFTKVTGLTSLSG